MGRGAKVTANYLLTVIILYIILLIIKHLRYDSASKFFSQMAVQRISTL